MRPANGTVEVVVAGSPTVVEGSGDVVVVEVVEVAVVPGGEGLVVEATVVDTESGVDVHAARTTATPIRNACRMSRTVRTSLGYQDS